MGEPRSRFARAAGASSQDGAILGYGGDKLLDIFYLGAVCGDSAHGRHSDYSQDGRDSSRCDSFRRLCPSTCDLAQARALALEFETEAWRGARQFAVVAGESESRGRP